MVSAARPLLARIDSIAIATPSSARMRRWRGLMSRVAARRWDRGATRGARGTRRRRSRRPCRATSRRRATTARPRRGAASSAQMIFAALMPSTIPIIAPTVLSVADSTRNWRRMSRRRAPSDFRIPISCVRSATDTSMMFMITMPPTIRPIAGSAVPTIVIVFLIFSKNASADADVSMTKLSGLRRAHMAMLAQRLAHHLHDVVHHHRARRLDEHARRCRRADSSTGAAAS